MNHRQINQLFRVLFLLFQIIPILFFSQCKKIIDEIPNECFEQEEAYFYVNDSLQIIDDESVFGANPNYMFSVKPTGECSIAIESEVFSLTIFSKDFISFTEYENMNLDEWVQTLNDKGNFELKTSNLIQNFMFNDIEKNILLDINDLKSGTLIMKYIDESPCFFITADVDMIFEKDSLVWNVKSTAISTITKKE
ncbi:MAG TPA: hypothetical protein DDX39_01415 [Bacteroidales bacterium]|nr:MAG: hypothetical protein A2W98_07630 [Bacteroidetes bacterium GWF2_33_38]OFY76545.1 MAG: hypothetical protein A2265_10995 [Bacteroidetes bacterium RIFOXYA12_FULL_33_9]OFY87520.1 MAG: hypothetical protein A2236_06550 [Bacteroidetes bacterium RIFOXYA2_FULL_33_7]HBF87270.1 hypothetical protein [Bacteroidales bacterium]